MPQFDLRKIRVAKYNNKDGVISYTTPTSAGDAMTVNFDLRFAEGRLYAESTLAEYMRKATGGTISIGVKYIPKTAQMLMFGNTEKTRQISYTPTNETEPQTKTVTILLSGGKTQANYVGLTAYAPDLVDGEVKYTAFKIARTLFGQPGMNLQTAGENIQFSTPTTTGEFLADHSATQDMLEIAVLDTEDEAIAWTEAVLK